MQVLSVHLRGFRNLLELRWSPSPGLVLVAGENGQGKTNLIEAIHLGLLGRSFRARRDAECVSWSTSTESKECALVELSVRRAVGVQENRVVLSREGRQCFRDGKMLARLGDLWSGSPVVLFRPEDASIFRESPARRRKLLDSTLAQSSPFYLECLRDYQKGVREINALLRARPSNSMGEQANVYHRLLAESGAHVMRAREDWLGELRGAAADYFQKLGGVGRFEVSFAPDVRLPPGELAGNLASAALMRVFESRWGDHLRIGTLGTGPHRDDFVATLDGRELGRYGSQGQNRLAALALTLAIAFRLGEKMGDAPVLLLDDFGSELDLPRRSAVLAEVRERMQTFVTATSPDDLGGASAFDEVCRLHAGRWA